MASERQREIKRRRHRQAKLRHLRARVEQTTDPRERERLIQKMHKISPRAPVPE